MRLGAAVGALLVAASAAMPAAPAAAQTATPPRVRVELTGLDAVVGRQPDSVLHLRATITNDSSETVEFVRWRLRRGDRISTRSGVAQAAETPPAGETFWRKTEDVVRELPAGASEYVALDIPMAELDLPRTAAPAIYPLRFEVTSRISTTIGRADSFLIWWPDPEPPAEPTLRIGWVVPLTEVPARSPGGANPGDQLSKSVAPGGRLDVVLAVLERAAVLSGSTLQVTLAIDGQLVESVAALTEREPGAVAAAQWLARLRELSRRSEVIALPYADADLVALVRAGLNGDVTVALRQSREAIREVLGVSARTSVTWPVDGAVDTASVSVLADNAIDAVILDDQTLPLTGTSEYTQTAAYDLDTTARKMTALVADSPLRQVIVAASPLSAVTTRQRLLAETAVTQQERPGEVRDVVLPLPRLWLPVAIESSAQMLALPATTPWLGATTVSQTLREPGRGTGRATTPHYPEGARRAELPSQLLRDVTRQRAALLSFGTILVAPEEPPASDVAAVAEATEQRAAGAAIKSQINTWREEALARALSAHWRTNVRGAVALRAAVEREFESSYRSKIRVQLNKVRLTSTRGPVPITIVNELRTPVRVRLTMRSQRPGLTFAQVPDQTVPPTGAQLSVRFQARTIGKFPVEVALLTPENDSVGPPKTTVVSTTAYGTVALAVTITAFVLLVIAVVVRFVFRRRRGGSAADSADTPDAPFPEDDPALAPLTHVGGPDAE